MIYLVNMTTTLQTSDPKKQSKVPVFLVAGQYSKETKRYNCYILFYLQNLQVSSGVTCKKIDPENGSNFFYLLGRNSLENINIQMCVLNMDFP